MDLQLAGKVALVTGGGRGIGKEIAIRLADEGVRVAVCGRSTPPLDSTVAELVKRGVRTVAIKADLLDPAQCVMVVDRTVELLGRLDVLINNASTNVDAHRDELEYATDDEVLERVMIKGVAGIRCTRAALPHLRRSGSGRVIFMGGVASRAVPFGGGGLSKGLGNSFVAHFSKALSAQVAADGITANVLLPGETRTDRFTGRIAEMVRELGISESEAESRRVAHVPIGRMVEPGDVAAMAVFLASPLASAITGQAIAIDGGASQVVIY